MKDVNILERFQRRPKEYYRFGKEAF